MEAAPYRWLGQTDANPASQLLLHILAAVAQFERELIRERVAAGIKAARAKGKHIGRPKRVFDRAEVYRLRHEGLSISQIASRVGIGVGTVVRTLAAQPPAASGGAANPERQ